jgi:hypothetical protein
VLLDGVGVHQAIQDLLLFQFARQQFPEVIGRLHRDDDPDPLLLLAHSLHSRQKVFIATSI